MRAKIRSETTDSNDPETFCSSGTSPTLHLIGPGAVGRAFLGLIDGLPFRLIGVSDRSATVHDRLGLDPLGIAASKARGDAIASLEGSETLPLQVAVSVLAADVVVDASSADPRSLDQSLAWCRAALSQGSRLILARKDALAEAAVDWFSVSGRLGCNAVLGGTGGRLLAELAELRQRCNSVSLVGNASSTAILEMIETGGRYEDGLAAARRRGLLETDPDLDLRGHDAAAKLAIVAAAVFGRRLDQNVLRVDLGALDLEQLRQRAVRGRCTRLVARCSRTGEPSLAFEELAGSSPLAVPSDRAAYAYDLGEGHTRLHIGCGLGPLPTARALVADLCGSYSKELKP